MVSPLKLHFKKYVCLFWFRANFSTPSLVPKKKTVPTVLCHLSTSLTDLSIICYRGSDVTFGKQAEGMDSAVVTMDSTMMTGVSSIAQGTSEGASGLESLRIGCFDVCIFGMKHFTFFF